LNGAGEALLVDEVFAILINIFVFMM